jgi:hypothetical protein
MNKAVAWLEDGFDETCQHAMVMSERYDDNTWVPGWCDTEYTKLCRPIRIAYYTDNAFYSIKGDCPK